MNPKEVSDRAASLRSYSIAAKKAMGQRWKFGNYGPDFDTAMLEVRAAFREAYEAEQVVREVVRA